MTDFRFISSHIRHFHFLDLTIHLVDPVENGLLCDEDWIKIVMKLLKKINKLIYKS